MKKETIYSYIDSNAQSILKRHGINPCFSFFKKERKISIDEARKWLENKKGYQFFIEIMKVNENWEMPHVKGKTWFEASITVKGDNPSITSWIMVPRTTYDESLSRAVLWCIEGFEEMQESDRKEARKNEKEKEQISFANKGSLIKSTVPALSIEEEKMCGVDATIKSLEKLYPQTEVLRSEKEVLMPISLKQDSMAVSEVMWLNRPGGYTIKWV